MTTRSRILIPALAVALAVSVLLAPAVTASEKSGAELQVKSATVSGNVVTVAVSNLSAVPGSGTLQVATVVQGVPVRAVQSIAVHSGQTAYVSVAFSGMVSGSVCASIGDSLDPVL